MEISAKSKKDSAGEICYMAPINTINRNKHDSDFRTKICHLPCANRAQKQEQTNKTIVERPAIKFIKPESKEKEGYDYQFTAKPIQLVVQNKPRLKPSNNLFIGILQNVTFYVHIDQHIAKNNIRQLIEVCSGKVDETPSSTTKYIVIYREKMEPNYYEQLSKIIKENKCSAVVVDVNWIIQIKNDMCYSQPKDEYIIAIK